MAPSAKRKRAWQRGRTAERICVFWLICLGYRIVSQRLRTPVGEIDIVARRGKTLAIIEVKARSDKAKALGSISPRQRKRLQRAVQWLIASRPDLSSLSIRFDVIAIVPWRLPARVIDAWRPEAD